MPDFPIDPELRIRVNPPGVLRRATEAMAFIRKMTLGCAGRAAGQTNSVYQTENGQSAV